MSGRIDTFVAEESVLAFYLKESGYSIKLKNAGNVSEEDIFIGFTPNFSESQSLADHLDNELSDKLIFKYMLKYIDESPTP